MNYFFDCDECGQCDDCLNIVHPPPRQLTKEEWEEFSRNVRIIGAALGPIYDQMLADAFNEVNAK